MAKQKLLVIEDDPGLQKQLHHLAGLLAHGELSVGEVAQRVGYANATALRKLTLKMAQLPPGLLRHGLGD